MGTFLRVVGVVAMCLGVVFAALVLLGAWNWMGAMHQSAMPFPGMLWSGSFGGVLGGFGIFVGGASLFCLGTIYNDVKSLRGR